MSPCGVPWTSSWEVALKQMSMPLAFAIATACGSTAARSRASRGDVRCTAVAVDALGDRLERRDGAADEMHLGSLAAQARVTAEPIAQAAP